MIRNGIRKKQAKNSTKLASNLEHSQLAIKFNFISLCSTENIQILFFSLFILWSYISGLVSANVFLTLTVVLFCENIWTHDYPDRNIQISMEVRILKAISYKYD